MIAIAYGWVLCCEFKLESGVYTSTGSMTVPALVVSYENCELCISNPGLDPPPLLILFRR